MTSIFTNKIAIVTGGASGIGLELVRQLVAAGATVVVTGREMSREKVFSKDLGGVLYLSADMADALQAEKVFATIQSKYKTIDYVFNNAGIFMGGEIRDTSLKDWKPVVDNNIWAVFNGTHFAYQIMLKQGFGHILNIASATGIFPTPGMGIYGSSKHAIVGLSNVLRIEAKKLGVKVSVACPTVVDTPLYDTATYNKVNVKRALNTRKTFRTPDVTARKILNGVRKNKAIIHTASSALLAWWLYRISPTLYGLSAQKVISVYREKLRKN